MLWKCACALCRMPIVVWLDVGSDGFILTSLRGSSVFGLRLLAVLGEDQTAGEHCFCVGKKGN